MCVCVCVCGGGGGGLQFINHFLVCSDTFLFVPMYFFIST